MKVQGPKSKAPAQRSGRPGVSAVTPRSAFRTPRFHSAFTILEVIVACTIFFMVAFAILELVTRSLAAAKAIQRREPDPGIIMAMY